MIVVGKDSRMCSSSNNRSIQAKSHVVSVLTREFPRRQKPLILLDLSKQEPETLSQKECNCKEDDEERKKAWCEEPLRYLKTL